MYEELASSLRKCGRLNMGDECICFHDGCCEAEPTCMYELMRKAADAIEELQQVVKHYKGCSDDWYKEACDYKAMLPRWIPVTERLPKDGVAVNVVWSNHSPVIYYQHIKDKPQTATGVYYRGQWYWWSAVAQDYLAEYGEWEPDKMDTAIEVTHWMPLPSTEGLDET